MANMPLPPPPKTELKAVRDEQDIVAEEQWIPKMRQRIKVSFRFDISRPISDWLSSLIGYIAPPC